MHPLSGVGGTNEKDPKKEFNHGWTFVTLVNINRAVH